jgi:uncharacterized protein YbjT (DUF2867 family)
VIASSQLSSITNIATADQKRLVIVGATGMVGGYTLRYALEHPTVGTVTTIGRKKLGISHPKLREVLHRDFADCSALAETLSGQGAALFCLGAYTGAVPDAELRTITVDYTIEFARVLRESSPGEVKVIKLQELADFIRDGSSQFLRLAARGDRLADAHNGPIMIFSTQKLAARPQASNSALG